MWYALEREEMGTILVENMKKRDHMEDLGINVKIRWVYKKHVGVWVKMEINGGIL